MISHKEGYAMIALYVKVRNWLRSEEGQDLAEYALLIGLIALVVVFAVTTLGEELDAVFTAIAERVASWAVPGG
jgi:pilus assembly protein Flp/PilA